MSTSGRRMPLGRAPAKKGLRELTACSWVGAIAVTLMAGTVSVPEPWSAVRIDGHKLSCWNRHYDFKDKLLAADIRSGPAALLNGPMRLSAFVSGVRQDWKPASFSVKQAAPDIVEFSTAQESGLLRAVCEWRIEFDGMLLCDLSVYSRNGSLTLSSLELAIPLNPAHAKLYHHHPVKTLYQQRWGTDAMNCGALPHGSMQLPFVHHIWLGDENCGLQWFAETGLVRPIGPRGYSPPDVPE